MALTGASLIAGVFICILPIIVIFLNKHKPRWGWYLLVGLIIVLILGNILECAFSEECNYRSPIAN
jgi:predicted PurR-regulated permease PerM